MDKRFIHISILAVLGISVLVSLSFILTQGLKLKSKQSNSSTQVGTIAPLTNGVGNQNGKSPPPVNIDLTKQPLAQLTSSVASASPALISRLHTGAFVGVDSAWCDQNNLANLLGTLYMDQLGFRAAPNNWNKTFYGETDWQYSIQGKITSLNTSDKNHITITVVKDNSSFTGNFTDTIPQVLYNLSASPVPNVNPNTKIIDLSTIKTGDLAIVFLAVKCGGGRSPAVAIQAIEKISQFLK